MSQKLNYIYLDGIIGENLGGPAGYLANLQSGLKSISKLHDIKFIVSNKKKKWYERTYKNISNYNDDLNDFYWNGPNDLSKIIDNINHCEQNFSIPPHISRFINFKNAASFHIHSTRDWPKLHNIMNMNNSHAPVILTSHSPTLPYISMETFVSEHLSPENTKKYCAAYRKFDELAFSNSDAFIFPAKHAIDSYFNDMDNFAELVKNKKMYFVPTGTNPLSINQNKTEFRRQYNIPDNAFMISYAGRHDEEKGFDTLVNAGKKILQQYENVYICCAGNQSTQIKTPEHPRWIEIGYSKNIGNLVNASDVFVLPNKKTFYDLILLEVLSIGTPIVATHTGGNISVAEMTNGIITYEYGSTGLYNVLADILTNPTKLVGMKESNLDCYNNNFTLAKFAQNYYDTIIEIQSDFYAKDNK